MFFGLATFINLPLLKGERTNANFDTPLANNVTLISGHLLCPYHGGMVPLMIGRGKKGLPSTGARFINPRAWHAGPGVWLGRIKPVSGVCQL